jgi:uroporphyrinogen-III decarboxylase
MENLYYKMYDNPEVVDTVLDHIVDYYMNVNHILIESDSNTVKEKIREVIDIMKPGGGFVAGASHDTILEGTPIKNVLAMFDAIREYGMY